jgi:hypothetical protein
VSKSELMRASDAEREDVAVQLREHCAAGRLTPEELDDRLAAVYAAKVRGELKKLTEDLPKLGRRERYVEPLTRQQRKRAEFTHDVFSFVIVGVALWIAWALLGKGWFWPALVLVPWGAGLAFHAYDTFVNHRITRLEGERRQLDP